MPLQNSDILYLERGGTPYKFTIAELAALIGPGGGGGNAGGAHAREGRIKSGSYLSQALLATGSTTVASAANRLDFMPFGPAVNITINELAVEVTTLIAGSTARIGIYSANALQEPGDLIVGTGLLDCATVGVKAAAIANTQLLAGVKYWLAVHTSSNQTLRALTGATLIPVEAPISGTTIATLLRATSAFGAGLPAVVPAVAAVSANAPYFRMKVA